MGFWDFAPASGSRAKPITKAALRRMQAQFAAAAEVAEEVRQIESVATAEEKEKAASEMEGLWL